MGKWGVMGKKIAEPLATEIGTGEALREQRATNAGTIAGEL
jgi:hypothetical protein